MRGYLLLQHALQEDFGINLEGVMFLDSGKPILKGQSIHFNISHSGNLVGVAISKIGVLGLDIEQYRKFEKVESAFSFFSAVEQKAILNAEMPNRKLIEFWSKKEALVKAVGGQMFDMSALTDIRHSSTSWLGLTYFLYTIQHEYDNYIWIASSFPCNNITTKQVKSL